ncbi:hypothetical protein [Pseudomonas sp. 22 E 5]|nr:hypothetical protein [Pseudomonas sp. 22 E 5]
MAGARQQQGQDQAGDADPQQVREDERAAIFEGGDDRHGQAEQGGPHRYALVEQHDAGEQAQPTHTQAQGAGVLTQVVAVPAEHQFAAGLDKALFRWVFHGVDRGVRHVEGVVAQAHQAEPARLVVTGQKLEAAQAPVLQRVAFHVGDKARVGHHVGTEHRHAPGHGQYAFGQGHGAHVDVALGEAQLVPLAHDVAAAHFAEFVGGQTTDIAEQLEPRHGLAHYALGEHGVAIDHRHHGAVIRQVARDGAETEGQAVAFTGAGDAHEVELYALRRVHAFPQAFHQQLIGHLHQRAHHGGWETALDGFANHRAVDLRGGQRVDTETGDHQEYVGRVGSLAQLAHLAAQVRVDHVQEEHAAKEMRSTHRVAPDADGANQENKILRLGVERTRRQQQGETHQQAEEEQPAGGLEQYVF